MNALQTDDEGRVKLTTKLLKTRAVETRLSDRLNDGAPPRPVVLWLRCPDVDRRGVPHGTWVGRRCSRDSGG